MKVIVLLSSLLLFSCATLEDRLAKECGNYTIESAKIQCETSVRDMWAYEHRPRPMDNTGLLLMQTGLQLMQNSQPRASKSYSCSKDWTPNNATWQAPYTCTEN